MKYKRKTVRIDPGVSAFAGGTRGSLESVAQEDGHTRQLSAGEVFGLALVDKDMRVLSFNQKFFSFFPLAANKAEPLCAILQKDCSAPDGCAGCPAQRCLKSGVRHEREFARILPDAQEQYFRFVASPVTRASGTAVKTVNENQFQPVHSKPATSANGPVIRGLTLALLEDITGKRLLEQKLLRAQRLEAMSTLAGGIAHEINQPLSALNLYASGLQILLDKDEQPPLPVIRERVGLILDQARKISDITRHMRAMAARSNTVIEEVDVRSTLQEVLLNLKDKFRESRVEPEVVAPGSLPLVKAIGVQLSQVFGNLLLNALQALETRQKEPRPGRIRVSLKPENSRLRIEVADSGPGLAPGMERRIFDPFFSTKGPGGGMGLGLSLVHAFVQSWGGEMQVSSRHPELGGAVFTILLHSV